MNKMKISKILVPIDFSEISEAVVPVAMDLASKANARVHLFHVIEFTFYNYYADPQAQAPPPPSIPNEEMEAENKMKKLKEKIKSKYGIDPKTKVVPGNVHREIIDYAEKEKVDLIIMGTHGASASEELFIGSNAQRVVTLSEIPVLTLQKKKKISGFKNILIPIDDSTHSREKVNIALLIGSFFDAKIHIIGLPDSTKTEEINQFKVKLLSVEKMVQAHKLPYVTTIVHGKSLAKTAMKYASQQKCDLIVINTGHESKITGIFLGAFAQQIVNHSKVPVLSFRHTHSHYTIDTPGFGV